MTNGEFVLLGICPNNESQLAVPIAQDETQVGLLLSDNKEAALGCVFVQTQASRKRPVRVGSPQLDQNKRRRKDATCTAHGDENREASHPPHEHPHLGARPKGRSGEMGMQSPTQNKGIPRPKMQTSAHSLQRTALSFANTKRSSESGVPNGHVALVAAPQQIKCTSHTGADVSVNVGNRTASANCTELDSQQPKSGSAQPENGQCLMGQRVWDARAGSESKQPEGVLGGSDEPSRTCKGNLSSRLVSINEQGCDGRFMVEATQSSVQPDPEATIPQGGSVPMRLKRRRVSHVPDTTATADALALKRSTEDNDVCGSKIRDIGLVDTPELCSKVEPPPGKKTKRLSDILMAADQHESLSTGRALHTRRRT